MAAKERFPRRPLQESMYWKEQEHRKISASQCGNEKLFGGQRMVPLAAPPRKPVLEENWMSETSNIPVQQ